MIYKAYKFRMYPTIEQKNLINQTIGSNRFIYNYYLFKKSNLYKENKINYKLSEMKKDIKVLLKEYPWLRSIDSSSMRITLDNLDNAYTNFFNKGNYPNYKKKSISGFYTTTCIRSTYKDNNYANINVNLDKRIIKLPKLKNVKIKGYRKLKSFPYKIINATISRVADKYYVSVLVEEEKRILPKTNNIIGIDLGVKDLVITSNGEKYTSLDLINKYEKKIAGLNKWLSRCLPGSKNRYKVRVKIQRFYTKLKNARKYYTDIITKRIIEENDIIISEDLKIKDMIISSKYSKYISSSSLSLIVKKLEYKSNWYDKVYIKVNTYYPSSQICSKCGSINKEMKDLSIRKWKCNECNMSHDRDINASINILEEGLNIYQEKIYEELKV